jgi:uncharacterized membrane protein YraQ (UPF0718 family)
LVFNFLQIDGNIIVVIPLVEAMLLKGVAVGTTLAFMMSIAAISLPELLILKKVMHWRALALFTGIVAVSITLVEYQRREKPISRFQQ